MKNKIITAAMIVGSALAHTLPAIGIATIAIGDEPSRALGTCLLFVSSLSLGYIHGLNRTHKSFV